MKEPLPGKFAESAEVCAPFEQILGIRFFNGSAAEAVENAVRIGGLIVAPSGTCFERLCNDAIYRRALTEADLALPDSGFMVLLCRLLRRKRINRVSGFAYLKQLLNGPALSATGAAVWVLPNNRASEKALRWLRTQGFGVSTEDTYVAPFYRANVEDETLLGAVGTKRPRHIVIALAGGVQEKLGYFLREQLPYRPTIHCIGGALGFLTGDQIAIPDWADRFFLGWTFRLVAEPRRFLRRLWSARVLPALILKCGDNLPPAEIR
ncbi:MAG: WecB/TagA/CpsF family glycosyltransferase [Chthoniobacterales bacterium]